MSWGRRARIAVDLCIVAVVLGLGTADPVSAEPAATGPNAQAHAPELAMAIAAVAEDPSVVSLVADYGLTIPQARAQMEAQVAAGRAEAQMPKDLSEVYTGRQIFHDRGGHVVVGITDSSQATSMSQHFARFGVHTVELRRFPATRSQIEQRVQQARALLQAGRAAGEVTRIEVGSRTLGKVTIRVDRRDANGAQARLNSTEAGILAAAQASPELYEVIEVDKIPASQEEACDFTGDIECDPPLRGSVRIDEADGSICSAGFNARSRTDGLPYVLTAGHCNDGAGNWRTQFADESVHVIGPFHRSRNDAVTDVGILRVNNPTGWQFGRPWVTVDPTGGEAAQQAYVIEDVLNPGLNDRVCATLGNSARTDCGEVTDTNVTGGGTDGLFEVDALCTEGGDSGSPYFSYHVAYGVHSAGDGVSGTTGCQFGRAEHAIEAQNQMNVNIITA